jgi:hypothetical protein
VPVEVGPEPQATALDLLRADASTEDWLSRWRQAGHGAVGRRS